MEENEISFYIRKAIFKTYNTFGPGLLESVYEKVLKIELEKEKLRTYGRLKVYAVGNGVEHIFPGDEVMIDPSSAARGVVKIPLSEDKEVIMVSVFDVAHVW